jgi:hypothetical protein
MHTSKSDTGIGDNVWQGYVSAVACLLLSLLLLLSIMALSMIALGGQKTEEQAAEPVPAPMAASNIAPSIPKGQRGAQWALRFPANAVDIEPEEQAVLAKRLSLTSISPGADRQMPSHWSLWCYATAESVSSQRLAYLRLLAVREVLIKQGVPADTIDIQIRPAGASEITSDETLILVSNTKATETADIPPLLRGISHGNP